MELVLDGNSLTIDKDLRTSIDIIEVDFLKIHTLDNIPDDIDGAYYLIHSMATKTKNFDDLESLTAFHFREKIEIGSKDFKFRKRVYHIIS